MNCMKHLLIILLITSNSLYSHLLIITHSYNRPDFIEIQYKTFKKFMHDEYEFIVFNDARDSQIREQINKICSQYQISCIEIPQEIHDRPYLQRDNNSGYNHSAVRCANVVQYSLDILGFDHDDLVMIIDSDMFLVNEFSVREYLKNHDIAALPQCRSNEQEKIDYIWNGLIFFNMATLPHKRTLNFNCGWVNGALTDVGGYTYYYFKNNPDVKLKHFESLVYVKDFWCNNCFNNPETQICIHNNHIMDSLHFSNPLKKLVAQDRHSIMEVFINNTFLHYRAGGNWNNESAEYHQKKTALLNTFINELLEDHHFFLTGDLDYLTTHKDHKNLGQITVLTEPISTGASCSIQGHTGVTSSVLRGFNALSYPMNYNPTSIEEVGEHIFVLVNTDALAQAIQLKKEGRIKTLIVGPNILNNPHDCNHILGSPEVDWYIAPCKWARDCNIEEEPLIKGKTAIWYAGVDTEYWKPDDNKTEQKTILVYWKTESEDFCLNVERVLACHGWKTIRIKYGAYSPEQYKELLKQVDAAVFISVSESQGLALAECWSMNIPTLVWNPETAFIYNRWLPVSSAPYLTNATGHFFKTFADLENILSDFDAYKKEYNPRWWVKNYMTDQMSVLTLLNLIDYTIKTRVS